MTLHQIAWAQTHDWFRYAKIAEGKIYVRDYVEEPDGNHKAIERVFTSYQKLRAWAGY